MYKCRWCGKTFNELKVIKIKYDDYYGKVDNIGCGKAFTAEVCPFCDESDYEEIEEEE